MRIFLLATPVLVCHELIQRITDDGVITDASVDGDGDILPSNPVPFRPRIPIHSGDREHHCRYCFGYDPTLMIWPDSEYSVQNRTVLGKSVNIRCIRSKTPTFDTLDASSSEPCQNKLQIRDK